MLSISSVVRSTVILYISSVVRSTVNTVRMERRRSTVNTAPMERGKVNCENCSYGASFNSGVPKISMR